MSKKNNKISFFLLLSKYAKPLWKHIIALVFLTITANVFTTLQPVLMSGIIEVLVDSKEQNTNIKTIGTIPSESKNIFNLNYVGQHVKNAIPKVFNKKEAGVWGQLVIILGLFLLVVFIASLINYLALVLTRWVRTSSSKMIRRDILIHLLSLNIAFFNKQKSGEIISRITQDAQNVGQGLGPLVRGYLHHTVLIVIYSSYLFCTSIWMTLGAITMIFLQFGLTQLIKKSVRRTTKEVFNSQAGLTSTLQETFTNIRVIKSFGAEKYEQHKLDKDLEIVRKAGFREGVVRHIEPYAREFLDAFAMVGIFIIAAIQLMSGGLSVQGFLLFIYVGRLLITPINKFAVALTWTQALLASYERIDDILNQKPQVVEGKQSKSNFKEIIEFKNVTFQYEKEVEFSIQDVSLNLHKGEILAFVGPSGAGKSTLTDLLLRFYDPQEGRIMIDGIDLRDLKTSNYRKMFGVVPQESLLFNDTIANNISYGRMQIAEQDVVEAAKIANAHNFITELPQDYDTFVGDRGVRLSGGQRQRIAIARAIAPQPDIIIFDEATSALDTESEKQVQAAVDGVLQHCTAVVIAHRLSTILHADKIIVLNRGEIEAMGQHQQLLEKCPTYKKLYELQFEINKAQVR